MIVPRIVHALTKEVRKNITEHRHYVIAVSGGADSLVLADICASLSEEGYATFTVCHIEHGIRGQESLEDMYFVEHFCKSKDLPYVGVHVDAYALAEKNKLSLEEAARKLRYEVLRRVMFEEGAYKIMTAHQADDQAETVLWRLIRGAGIEGLSGMNLEKNDILRPLINVSRQEILSYISEKQLEYRVDSTNKNFKYTRNRIRQELLPFLANNYNERIMEVLARTAKVLGEDAACLDDLANGEYDKVLINCVNGITLDAKKLQKLSPAISKRIVRIACFKMGLDELDYERTQAIQKMLERNTGNKVIELHGGIKVTLKNHMLIFQI